MIRILATPIGHSTRGQTYKAEVEGKLLVGASHIPFCDACRVLLSQNVDPSTPAVMIDSNGTERLKSTVGVAAGLTVYDDNSGKPRFQKFHKWNRKDIKNE